MLGRSLFLRPNTHPNTTTKLDTMNAVSNTEFRMDSTRTSIESLRSDIIAHPLYQVIQDVEDLKIFMHYHVYAVWDFMSLLKALQSGLTCTGYPWFPVGSANTRFLINEIVVGEESDIDEEGVRMSHFELYLKAMKQAGASAAAIETFIKTLQQSHDFDAAFQAANTPLAAQRFVNNTFEVIGTGKAHVQAAVFTFGREDLIPGMFMELVRDLHKKFPESIGTFKYYLERHIEVDGDHHSHLATEMTTELCGNNDQKWYEAQEATLVSLKHRKLLWDGAYEEILARRN